MLKEMAAMTEPGVPDLLQLTRLETIAPAYKYIGVYTACPTDPPATVRLALLYAINGQKAESPWADDGPMHYATLAAEINDFFEMPGGSYQMLAGTSVAVFPEVIECDALRRFASEDEFEQPQ
jgi:hypothetical protein